MKLFALTEVAVTEFDSIYDRFFVGVFASEALAKKAIPRIAANSVNLATGRIDPIFYMVETTHLNCFAQFATGDGEFMDATVMRSIGKSCIEQVRYYSITGARVKHDTPWSMPWQEINDKLTGYKGEK